MTPSRWMPLFAVVLLFAPISAFVVGPVSHCHLQLRAGRRHQTPIFSTLQQQDQTEDEIEYIDPDDRHDKDIDALIDYYFEHEDHRRAHAIAPPGYGKTLFSLLTLTELKARGQPIKTALYVVPRLNLADQVLGSCDKFGVFRNNRHRRIMIGSRTNRHEQRTTKPEVIAEFLSGAITTSGDDASSEMHFVVSTYDSLPRVGEALQIIQEEHGLDAPPSIDFAIFDEAHRTEGYSDLLGFGLYDENIDIKQRMFVTATPNDYTDRPRRLDVIGHRKTEDGSVGLITKSVREGDEPRIEVRSFRDENLYGPCIVQKTSEECVANGITVPTKLCCLSKKEMFSELGRELNVSSYSRDELVPFAVLAAHSKLGINKIVSYHSNLGRSREFVEMARPLFEEEGFYLTDVDGTMSRAEQDRRLAKLRSVEKSLVTNCRLWREGVDVPEWDLVVLADPVKSAVAAKQIIGRASRPHTDKKTGYVLIPHIFDEETGLEVGGEGYGEFVTVFQAMIDDDPQLQKDIIFVDAATRTDQPLNVTEYPPRLLETFQLPESIDLLVRQNFISSVVMEMGGNNLFSWMDWYALLEKYKEREGDCLVPKDHVEEGKNLGGWVKGQRENLKTGGMTVRQKELLDDIGFCWDVLESQWLAQYFELKSYWENNGHCIVRRGELNGGNKLHRWNRKQRNDGNKGKLISMRRELLDEIEFCWDVLESRWQERYQELKAHWKQYGHCFLTRRTANRQLMTWANTQRIEYKKGDIKPRRQELLEEIGFTWDVSVARWHYNFDLLKTFVEREGHYDVPNRHEEDGEPVGDWLAKQRTKFRRRTLEASRQKQLEELGVTWDVIESAKDKLWMSRFDLLVKFKEREGHCNVPSKHVEDGEKLGEWLVTQRAAYNKGELEPERQRRMEELGVAWDAKSEKWALKFSLLVKFKEREGHCRVPSRHVEDGENLGYWLSAQKDAYRRGKLLPDRYEKLKALGVKFDSISRKKN